MEKSMYKSPRRLEANRFKATPRGTEGNNDSRSLRPPGMTNRDGMKKGYPLKSVIADRSIGHPTTPAPVPSTLTSNTSEHEYPITSGGEEFLQPPKQSLAWAKLKKALFDARSKVLDLETQFAEMHIQINALTSTVNEMHSAFNDQHGIPPTDED
ncbi:uncharacterized protein LOC133867943 isoform X1 [Alnus glutinosa]|uniref:uncharacterized protein LOC133867943 isoform X1 n=1 Tax=Alnus glutinosa TaxID=3517 RepID=UPI002D778672|nr:uncharacterized protein LOC133867943 isoform X1 [Alnus glutinosa]